jgi:hypothetical protein
MKQQPRLDANIISASTGPEDGERLSKLYVIYTHGKEDCALSIIPVSALAVR